MNDRELFIAVLQLKTGEERTAYLNEACGTDQVQRQRIEKLLQRHEESESFLNPDHVERTAAFEHISAGKSEPTPLEVAGDQIGPFKLLQKLGDGGMGTVWVAEQEKPVKRRVALKLVKAGMDSAEVLRRFEAERQALAMMDHTNIAKVFDAGTNAQGRPYFVMELIKGVPITKYCDEVHASIRDRLDLFIQVCSAVQHAHQKGIIHRDIKPSNVLVAMQDGKPVPKVIDFGVAKALHSKLADKTMYTEIGQVIGTLEYMAPEQAELSAMDIDTRADIYALGILLYELLTGSTPITRQRMKSAAFVEILRIIKEEEPPKPSTRLSESKESMASVASLRRTDPRHLSSELRGELDWVVLKALEKDRTRRYETANGLSRDLHRYLANEPVEARPASAGYRLRKFVRRNKGKVLAAGLVALALLIGVVGTTWGLIEAKKQAQVAVVAAEEERKAKQLAEEEKANALKSAAAEKAAKLNADAKRQEAERNLAFARKGNDILGSVFAGLDPKANYATVAELRNSLRDNLSKAVKELEGSAIGDPLEVAAMQKKLGVSLLALGETNLAINVFNKVLATRRERLGADHPDTLRSMNDLAMGYQHDGKMDQALPLFKETFKLTTAKLGANHPDTITSMNNLGVIYQDVGKMDQALPLLEESLKLRTAQFGADHLLTLVTMSNLAQIYQTVGRMDKALPMLEETFKLSTAKLGSDHPDTLGSMNTLALGYQIVGKLNQALPLYEQALKLSTTKLGADHPLTLKVVNNLAVCYRLVGKIDQAMPLWETTYKLSVAKLGIDHPDTLKAMSNLATGYQGVGKMDQALPLLEEAFKLSTAKSGVDHPDTLTSMSNLAHGYQAVGKMDKAIPLLEETLRLRTAKLGVDHPETLTSMSNLAYAYQAVGRIDLALALNEKAATGVEKRRYQQDNSNILITNTIAAYQSAKQFDKAESWRRKWLEVVKAEAGSSSPAYAIELAYLGLLLLKQQKGNDAEPILRECLAIREKMLPDVWTTFNTKSMLGEALLGQKKYTEAEPLLQKGYEGMKVRYEKTLGDNAGRLSMQERLPEALDRLIQFYTETNKPDEVKKWQAEKAKLVK